MDRTKCSGTPCNIGIGRLDTRMAVDCYTQTGVSAAIKLSDQWSILAGIHAGDDIAPWNAAAHPTGMFMARWVSKKQGFSLRRY